MAKWRKDFKKAPDRCLGWCALISGDEVRIIHRDRYIPGAWSAYGSVQDVVAWQKLPEIDKPAPSVPSEQRGRG